MCSNSYNSQQIESLVSNQKCIRKICYYREKVIVAKFNHSYIGFASLDMVSPRINGIYIHSYYSRQGVGTKLIKRLEELAIEKKYKVLYTMSSMNAIKFYESNGYSLVGSSGFWSDNRVWIPCAKMKKRLLPKTKQDKFKEILSYIILFVIVFFLLSYFI
ncbi:hypothetical protein CY0110_15842 [Crocosphaera chwakensis CCY0110]|uniref:N-acetyltransferase domain-containing protein n=1 Tax=Crocosphaera chwakensis CCY0110 TaxID=391612 RepID=A3IHK0_9CHRO|nr:hypothetical protein CY0110_15842 [Crocosphaera chwakensis CCY0110]